MSDDKRDDKRDDKPDANSDAGWDQAPVTGEVTVPARPPEAAAADAKVIVEPIDDRGTPVGSAAEGQRGSIEPAKLVEAVPEIVEHPHLFVSAPVAAVDGAGSIDDEAPLLPPAYSENELRLAAGIEPIAEDKPTKAAKPRRSKSEHDDPGDDVPHRRSTRTMLAAAGALVVGVGIVVLVFLGRANSDHYAIACEPDQVNAQQGRSFPPWGTRALAGAEWKPIAIPPEAECVAHGTEEVTELTGWYLEILIAQASKQLTAREITKVDLAEQQLKQALLLARAPERRDDRKAIERLLGDVGYWRASAKLKEAATALADAAKQFDEAAAQRPRYSSDASAWSAYVRKIVDQLHVGPAGVTAQPAFPPLPTGPERPTAPAGVALPVEPDRGSDAPAVIPPTPPDAGPPTGGVLL